MNEGITLNEKHPKAKLGLKICIPEISMGFAFLDYGGTGVNHNKLL
jgi:hypothetical protein